MNEEKNPLLDFETYSENCLKIITSDSKLVPLNLSYHQQRLIKTIERQKREGKPVRIIVLKARQVGLSTLACAYTYHKTATNFFQKSMHVAHDINSTSNLFNMVKRFYDLSPGLVKPLSRYSNRRELVFENPDDKTREQEPGLVSRIEVDTAGSTTAGRSSTIQNLHISELAFWPNAKETLSGLLQALSSSADSMCIIESTANGFDGDGREFYERCKSSQEGRSAFEFFFVPWWDVPHYKLQFVMSNLTDKEHKLKTRFKLSNDQLAWRRWKIANDFNGDEHLFCQEYPSFPEEAFIHSGRPVFNNEQLYELINNSNETYETDGYVRVFSKPKPDEVYVIGADVAEGLEEGDYSTAFVMDRNFNQVASIHTHIAPDLFAIELIKLARVYNHALLCPEVNNHGYTVVSKIKELGYTNLYRREFFEKQEIDIGQRLGWHTNVKTKQQMLDELKAAVRDGAIKIKDIDLLREMTTVSYEEDGNVTLNGKDRVVAAAIAIQGIKQTPSNIKYQPVYQESKVPVPTFETFDDYLRKQEKKSKVDSYFK